MIILMYETDHKHFNIKNISSFYVYHLRSLLTVPKSFITMSRTVALYITPPSTDSSSKSTLLPFLSSLSSLSHWTSGFGVPATTALKLSVHPSLVVTSDNGVGKLGGSVTIESCPVITDSPIRLLATTSYSPASSRIASLMAKVWTSQIPSFSKAVEYLH